MQDCYTKEKEKETTKREKTEERNRKKESGKHKLLKTQNPDK